MADRALTDADVAAIVERLADELEERRRRLVTARELAPLLGMDVEWVREHQHELGVIRVGDGPKPRLRFDPDVAIEALASRAAPLSVPGRRVRNLREPEVPLRRPRRNRAA